jgi:hypothetical protein
VVWLAGLVVAALATVLSGTLTSVLGHLFDSRAVEDRLAGGEDIAVTVAVVHDDSNFTTALTGRYDIPPDDPSRADLTAGEAAQLADRLTASGGYAVPYLRLRILLEGRRSQQIQVTDLAIIGLRSGPAPRGTLVHIPPQGGGAITQLAYDLSDPLPVAQAVGEDGPTGHPYFVGNGISLADREQAPLTAQLIAKPGASEEFRLQLRYTLGGRAKTQSIDDHGRPFRVAALNCSRAPDGSPVLSYDSAYLMTGSDTGAYVLATADDPQYIPWGTDPTDPQYCR